MKREIFKTITWRAIVTSATIIITYAFTQDLSLAANIGIVDVIIKSLLYFAHEMLWNKKDKKHKVKVT